jgi:hypothetical protein
MRNITAQYRDLLEGKMSKANFMTNVRRTFPDYITATNNFEDAIKILKNKRILSEDIHDRDILSTRGIAGHVNPKSNEDAYTRMVYGPILKGIAKKMSDPEFENHLNQLGYEEYWTGDVDTTIKGMDVDALRHMAKELMQGDMMKESDTKLDLRNAEQAAKMVAQANPSITSDNEALRIVDDMMEKAGISTQEITGAVNDPDWRSDFISALRLELDIARGEMEKGAEQDFLPEAKSSKKHKPDTKEEISEKEVKAKLESKHDGKQLEAALKVFKKIDISKFKTVGEAVKEIEANAKKQFPTAFESDEEPEGKKSLKEAAEKSEGSYKKVTGKDQYSVFSEIDRVNPYELKKGITIEMKMQYLPTPNGFTNHFNPDTVRKATMKALKNLQKDPAYYTNQISEPTEKRTNMPQKPKEMKVGPDGSTKIKGFAADKSNTQTNLGKKEKGSKSPEGVKEMKPSKRSMGGIKIMKSNEKLPKGVQLMQEGVDMSTVEVGEKVEITLNDNSTVKYERVGTDSKGEPTFKIIKDGKSVGKASTLSTGHIKSFKSIKEDYEKFARDYEWEKKHGPEITQATNEKGEELKVGDTVKTADPNTPKITITGFRKDKKSGKILANYSTGLTVDSIQIDALSKMDSADEKYNKLKEYIVAEVRKALGEAIYKAKGADGTESTYTADTPAAEKALKTAMPGAQKVQGSEGVHKISQKS